MNAANFNILNRNVWPHNSMPVFAWANDMVTCSPMDINIRDRKIYNVIVIQSQKELNEKTCKLFEEAKFNIHILDSYDLSLVLPDYLRKTDKVINAIVPLTDDLFKRDPNRAWLHLIKLFNHNIKYNDVAKYLDHITAWNLCVQIGYPCIIIESGVALKEIPAFESLEQLQKLVSLSSAGPAILNKNYHHLQNTKAYLLDSLCASSLLADVFTNGICDTLEKTLRIDRFNIDFDFMIE